MSKFGWDLPPGVTSSMIPGNSPWDEQTEKAADDLHKAFVQATLLYFTPQEIMTLWREAAEEAAAAEAEQAELDAAEAMAEMEMERAAERYWEEERGEWE